MIALHAKSGSTYKVGIHPSLARDETAEAAEFMLSSPNSVTTGTKPPLVHGDSQEALSWRPKQRRSGFLWCLTLNN